jgi:hypothetical protein
MVFWLLELIVCPLQPAPSMYAVDGHHAEQMESLRTAGLSLSSKCVLHEYYCNAFMREGCLLSADVIYTAIYHYYCCAAITILLEICRFVELASISI